mgnify:CR=1 FL=1
MPTGYYGINPHGVDYQDIEKWNTAVSLIAGYIRREFLPQQGLSFDNGFENEYYFRFKSPELMEFLIRPHVSNGWHFGDYMGEKGGVFILGPFAQRSDGRGGIVIFCSFPTKAEVWKFFESLARFVKNKMPLVLDELQPIGYQALMAV